MAEAHFAIAELDRRFGISGAVRVVADQAGNAVLRIATEKCLAAIHLHGAQVTSWKPAGTGEVIFLSSKARFAEGQAIRGGIPICFPWFRAKADDPRAPQHGFARTRLWALDSVENRGAEGIAVAMSTASDPATRELWPHDFRARLSATFGSKLQLEFAVTNTGARPFRYEEALHTYHHVGDVRKARVRGLEGASYLDNTDGNREKKQTGEVSIPRAADMAYLASPHALELLDPELKRSIHIVKQNSASTVIWNPGEDAAQKMSDLGAREWEKFLCAEGANILADAVELGAKENHTMAVTISVNAQ
ncbi:MAG: D-hexose-6-phosphate mutarotase [Candidatus Acidiferrum sp.]